MHVVIQLLGQTKNLDAMTRRITLESKVELFRDLLYDGWQLGDLREGILDTRVMQKLGCTPQSWSRYRPLLIQHCNDEDLFKIEVKDGVQMETMRFTMRYDKKRKKWYGKRNPLLIMDEEGHWHWRVCDKEKKLICNIFKLQRS